MGRGIIKMCNVEDYILEQGLEQKRESRDIWDYCFECSKPLTADMQEGKEWFNIRNNGESFPICKECKEKCERGELKPTDYITKEQFLDNTREREVFSVIHEFKERYNNLMKEENKQELILLDEDIRVIAEQMITEIKSQLWLPQSEDELDNCICNEGIHDKNKIDCSCECHK